MNTVVLRLLGTPQLEGSDGLEPLPLNAPTSLLFYLAVRNEWVSRQELAYLYRPDEPEDVALGYLRLQLHRAQRYPWAADLEVGHDQIRWPVETDLSVFRAAVALRDWPTAIQTARAPLLGSLGLKDRPTYNSWLERERSDCSTLLRTALVERARELASQGQHALAADQYRRLVELDELDEEATAGLVRALALAGEREQALRLYQKFVELLEDELGMEPAETTIALASQIRDGTLEVLEPARPDRLQLPQASTHFIGREAELKELVALLQDEACRLLSIVGMGGVGKTRLALELARRQAASFSGGCAFVSLNSASNLDQALRLISDGMQLQAEDGESRLEQMVSHLKERDLLLVLDNCEQIHGFGPFLSRVLQECPGVKLLATSRERLGLQGEWLYDLSGMRTEADARGELPEALVLFESAARRVAPRLKLDESDREPAARIAALVEGLPLALELAAAWVRLMPIDRIADEIGRSFELLETDLDDFPERHRSLNAILQRTWNDLTGLKADTLMRFSTFTGGATLAATEAVTGARLPLLLSLVNQSLLLRDEQGRFYSHPLLAQFSARILAREPSRESSALEGHARHFAGLLAGWRSDYESGSDALLRALMPDIGNIEKAWFWLVDAAEVTTLFEIADTLLTYYNVLGQYSQGLQICNRTLAQLPPPSTADGARLHCVLLLAQGTMLRERGDLEESLVQARAALELAKRFGFPEHEAKSLRYEGDVLQMLGRFPEAETSYGASQELYAELGDTGELASTLNSHASLEAVQEKFGPATERFERCVKLFEHVGDELARAIALNNLGYLADAQGLFEEATSRYEESLRAFERIRYTRGIAAVQNNLIVLYGMLGRLDEAEAAGHASLELKEQMNDRMGRIVTLKNLGDIQLMRKDAEAAMALYLPAIQLAHETGALPRLLQVLPGFAQALGQTGNQGAAELVVEALQRHPLTPPSARQRAAELWPHLPAETSENEHLLEQALINYVQAAA